MIEVLGFAIALDRFLKAAALPICYCVGQCVFAHLSPNVLGIVTWVEKKVVRGANRKPAMVASKLKQLSKQGLLILAMVSLIGGVKAISKFVKVADAVVTQPQTTSSSNAQNTAEFLVCSEASDWQRPSPDQQQKQLATDERYSSLLQDKDFQQLAAQFWQHDVLSFTTYGLSARTEPVNLSGLWSIADEIWADCYSHNEGNDINEGTLAEAWLMHHHVVELQWQNDRYVMVVEPNSRGMQVVQFARRESASELPLTIITTQGVVVDYHNADW